MGSYPWGRTAYEVLIDYIKTLAPEGGSYTISGMTVALLIWAYESVACFGESFGRVVNNEDVPLLRWGGKRTRASFDNLLAAEIKEHGEVRGKRNEKKKKMKGGVSSEAEPPTRNQKKVKTQNESEAAAAGNGSSEKEGSKDLELENKATLTTIVNTLDNISKKFEKFDSRLEAYELDQNRPLMDQKTIDDRVKALLEERLKVLGVGKIPENNDNPSPPSADKSLSLASPVVQTQQKSVNSPALAATPGKVFGPKKNLAKELDKESGVKRTLDEEFGSVAKATDLESQPLDFVLISPAKATKDDKDARVPAYGRGCRGMRIVKGEEADEKKKAAHADAAFKRKEKAEAKKKVAEAKKKVAELMKKQEAEGKKKEVELKKKHEAELKKRKQAESKNKEVTPSGEDSVFADVTDEVVGGENEFALESDVEDQEVIRSAVVREYREKRVQLSPKGFALTAVSSPLVFPYVGDDGTTCMRKNVTPSSVIYDPLAPVDPVLLEKLMQHIKRIPPKPPAPADKPEVLSADHESDFYNILIHERPWPEKKYGWVFDNHVAAYMIVLIKRSMRNPTPFWSKRIAFIDVWWQSFLIHDFTQFKIKPSMVMFKGNGYEDMLKGKLLEHFPTNLKWYENVDHLYGCLQTGRNHWVAYHVDLKKEKIDCYDPIFGEATPESEQRILNSFKPLTHMILYMLNDHIPANVRRSSHSVGGAKDTLHKTPKLAIVGCLALGVTFDGINDNNIQGLRMKMAAEILDEGGNTVMSNLLAN
ncbi:uncharacterized protein LOC106432987 [Brassica napus]|uniref:uncharacterized protein LOC106432987 n=1 Tax=Brassica napus TaxID=3708 RepID=UPI00207931F0|nr:uncharacterized protein LOC106432987 [Brassica napus]